MILYVDVPVPLNYTIAISYGRLYNHVSDNCEIFTWSYLSLLLLLVKCFAFEAFYFHKVLYSYIFLPFSEMFCFLSMLFSICMVTILIFSSTKICCTVINLNPEDTDCNLFFQNCPVTSYLFNSTLSGEIYLH